MAKLFKFIVLVVTILLLTSMNLPPIKSTSVSQNDYWKNLFDANAYNKSIYGKDCTSADVYKVPYSGFSVIASSYFSSDGLLKHFTHIEANGKHIFMAWGKRGKLTLLIINKANENIYIMCWGSSL